MDNKLSKHTKQGFFLANFVFYGLVIFPIINMLTDFVFNTENILTRVANISVVVFFLILTIITIYNTHKFYFFYKIHFNNNSKYILKDLLIMYIVPFIDIFRLPKLFTEVIDGDYNGVLNLEGRIVKRIIIFGYFLTFLYYISHLMKLEVFSLMISIISIVFGIYSGKVYTQIIQNIYLKQNEHAVIIEDNGDIN
jgi:hypothetical protein